MHICVLGGAGTIGATAAYTLLLHKPNWKISLVDPKLDAAQGHALDLNTSVAHAAHPLGKQETPKATTTRPYVTAYVDLDALAADCSPEEGEEASQTVPDLFLVTASRPRPEGAVSRGGRRSFLDQNRQIVDTLAPNLAAFEPVPVLVVTNPLDQITHRFWRQTPAEWGRKLFLGYSLSETARAAWAIANCRDVSAGAVSCPVMGEHGENIVPVFSRASIHGDPVEFSPSEQTSIRNTIRDIPYDVIEQRGEAETSRWVTGHGVALLAQALLTRDESVEVCLSTPLAGEYGYTDVALSVPLSPSATGVEQITEWDLTTSEEHQLEAAYNSVRTDINAGNS
jgi:malate dehydrogenase